MLEKIIPKNMRGEIKVFYLRGYINYKKICLKAQNINVADNGKQLYIENGSTFKINDTPQTLPYVRD